MLQLYTADRQQKGKRRDIFTKQNIFPEGVLLFLHSLVVPHSHRGTTKNMNLQAARNKY